MTREETIAFTRKPNGHEPACPYCGRVSLRVNSRCIYGRSYGRSYGTIFLCPECGAYVGQHRDQKGKYKGRPLGTLANAETRSWRKRAHAALDPLWMGRMLGNRRETYARMREDLGLTHETAHVAMQDAEGCRRIIGWARVKRLEARR